MLINPQFSQAQAQTHALCSLRNALAVLAGVNGALGFALLLVATGWRDAAERLIVTALWLEPASLLVTAALCLMTRRGGVHWAVFMGASASICFALAACSQMLHRGFGLGASAQAAGVGAMMGGAAWLALRQRSNAATPALQEADLRSLSAAMRPHFFFNALNAVMGLIRVNPRHAEDMLQDTAELFRDVMAQDQHRLVTLDTELDTSRRYVRIEQARLTDRLRMDWAVDTALLGAVLPPFSLQLLIENAVRHGIEPLLGGGEIRVQIGLHGQQLQMKVTNPVHDAGEPMLRRGNREKGNSTHNGMALANLRQRLALLYDQGAQLDCVLNAQTHTATLTLPLEFEK